MNIPHEITVWAQGKPPQNLAIGPRLSGGWERWAQVDMALLWKTVAGREVDTEVLCYINDKDRADIVVHLTGPQHWDIIELKAWKYVTDTLSTFFNAELPEDIVQSHVGLAAPWTSGTRTRWAVGLVSVAGLREHIDPNWTDAQALAYVNSHFPAVAAGGQVVNLNHDLAANGIGSVIISWCSF